MAAPVSLTGTDLDLGTVVAIAAGHSDITLAPAAAIRVQTAADFVTRIVTEGKRTYGVNTGFGALSTVNIGRDDLATLQVNLIRSHAAGVGEALPIPVVRAMLLLRANTLARGHSGVRVAVIERLLELIRHGIHPVVPAQGSVGASGDLAPLSHLALGLIGEGEVDYRGRRQPARDALTAAGLTPLTLGPKEGLALINGTQASVAIGALAIDESESLLDHADLIGAMTLEALRGRPSAFDARLHELRPVPGQIAVAAHLRHLLRNSRLLTVASDAMQDPYSLRCMPQVHGASRESVGYGRRAIEVDLNAVTDNPLLFPDTGEVFSGGNFHGEPVAQALDAAAIGLASLSAIAERRVDRLVSGGGGTLPMFLTENAGLSSGLMIAHVTAAALTSENKHLAGPASVDNIPTSAGKEDHVSFSTFAARKLATAVVNLRMILAIELIAAAQALDFVGVSEASPAARKAHAALRETVPHLDRDRELRPDLEAADELIQSRRLRELLSPR